MKILRTLLSLLLVLLALAAAGLFTLSTQWGGSKALQLATHVTAKSNYALTFGSFKGSLLSQAQISHLEVADAQGPWLTLTALSVEWQPLKLLQKQPPLQNISAEEITLTRLPQSREEEQEPTTPGSFRLQNYGLFIPQNLQIKSFTAGPAVTGQAQALTGHLNLSTSAGQTTLHQGYLQLAGTTLTAVGTFLPGTENLSATLTLQSPNLENLQTLTGLPLSGNLGAQLGVSGTLANLGATLTASSSSLAVAQTGQAIGSSLSASGHVNLKQPTLPFTTQGELHTTLKVENQAATPLNLTFTVSGSTQNITTSSTLAATRPGQSARVQFSGAATLPHGNFEAAATALLSKQNQRFTAQSHIARQSEIFTLGNLTINGPGILVSGSGRINVSTTLAEGNAQVNITNLQPLAATLGVQASGQAQGNVILGTSGNTQTAQAEINRLNITYGTYAVRLQKRATLQLQNQSGNLSPLTLQIAGGTITASGQLSPTAINGQLIARNLNLEQLTGTQALTGRVGGQLTITGSPAQPLLNVRGTLTGQSGEYPLQSSFKGSWQGGNLQLQAQANSGQARAQAAATLSATLSLFPFSTTLSTGTPVQGNLSANVPLEIFNPYLWASRQNVGGTLTGTMQVAGTLGQPQPQGTVRLAGGHYEHTESGICLQNLTAEVRGTRNQLTLASLRANNAEGGTLSGSAQLDLTGEMPVQGQVNLNNLHIFCGGPASGQIAGNLSLSGTAQRNLVGGELLVGPLNVQIPGNAAESNIPQVETRRAGQQNNEEQQPTLTRLNIKLNAPGQIFVRGRGLDAEFGGSLNIAGTTANPRLEGTLTAQRGRFTLFDRTLQLTETSLRFEGQMPPSPFLAVKATSQVQGTTVEVNLTGPAQQPAITLTSQPARPQDEVLALLLFGRQLSGISPFQAIQLAQAARTLTGADGGKPGVIDKARATLGLDTLDIGTGSAEGVTVTTGKYITDKIYLSVEQGSEPANRQVKTEVELTPSISGNTAVDGVGNQSIGIDWRRDY